MKRLTGRTITKGAALGTAAVVRWLGGAAHLPPRILEEMALVARKGIGEPMEVVLVAEDYGSAAALTIPGVRVVGIIAENAESSGDIPACPTLAGVEQAMSLIPDNALIVMDVDRGMALVDPDGAAVAAFQAERDRIAPRRRFYIDYAHEPARTQDGRIVRVSGVAVDEEGIAAAVEAGADGIFLLAGPSALPGCTDDVEQRDLLVRMVLAASGKPVVLVSDLETVAASALLQAARSAEVTLALPVGGGPEVLDEAREYLAETGRELSAAEEYWQPVGLAGVVAPTAEDSPAAGAAGVDRLVVDVTGVWDVGAPELHEWLDQWTAAAAQVMAPVEVILPEGALDAIGTIVALGASGLGVAPGEIQRAKKAIREMDAGTVRSKLLES